MEKNILIINVNWIGDCLFSTPFVKALREAYPESYMACLLHPRCKEMLESKPRLDGIIIYDEEGEHKGLLGKLKLILALRKKRFNVTFILHRSFTKALIATLAGIKERIGYPTKHRSRLLTRQVDEPLEEIHKVEYFLNIARAAGITAKSRSYEFFINEPDRNFIKGFLRTSGVSEKDLLVVLCPGGNWDPKRWPKENFAKIGDLLAQKFGARILISGAKKDVGLAEETSGMMAIKPIISCGRTSLKELGALLERANLVIANDTGPMHMAIAKRAKTIALFGPTSPQVTGPYGDGDYRVISKYEECEIPCYDFTCHDNKCMQAIRVEDVLRESIDLLGLK